MGRQDDRRSPSAVPALSRRRFLRWTLGAGGVVLMGSGGGLLALRGVAPDVEGLRILSAQEHRTVAMLARAVFPAGGAFRFSAADVDLARAFDRFLADEPPWNQRDLKSAILLLEYGPVVFERRLVTFSHLTDAERLRHFERWCTSDSELRRQVATAFRRFLTLVFYDQPGAWPGIGYDGPLFRLEDAP